MTKRDELIALDPAGLEAAVRECARITAPEISDVEYERIKADNSPRYQNTRAEMERTLRAYLNAASSQPNVQPALEAPAGEAEPEYLYDDERFNKGVQHVVDMLARELGVTNWVAGDGSEDYDCDLWQTILNILAAKGLYDKDEGAFAKPAPGAVAETPFAYAYEYPSYNGPVIRLGTYGREINGSKPIRAIPLYTHPTPSDGAIREALEADELLFTVSRSTASNVCIF